MQIIKRNGTKEDVKLEKISKRIASHGKDLKNIDKILIAQKVIQGLYDGVTSKELDKLATETAYSMAVKHPDYDKLAIRLAVSSLHKETKSSFSEVMKDLYNVKDSDGNSKSLLSEVVYKFVVKNAHILDSAIDYSRDFLFDYFGFKTLDRSYLLKIDGKIAERPQHMWMRCAIGIHAYDKDIDGALNTYNMLSKLYATHATPTLFNAGTPKNQLSSCFLVAMKDDSIAGIYETLKDVALISQSAGGIGIHAHDIRSKGSPIYGTNGVSNGLVPMLKNFNETARYVDQGGGRRKGSFAIYISPEHADILSFLDLRKNNGKEEERARDLNLALWVPDLFFKAVEDDSDWHLMDPNVSKGLSDVYDEGENGAFTKLYNKYVSEGKFVRKLKAREIWSAIITSQIETGQPYILAKDACNRKSNQNNLGTIKSSNLCAEIVEFSSPEEAAVCNLSSVSLTSFVEDKKGKKVFNFERLQEVVKILTENLNKIIDTEYYPTKESKKSNLSHRPIGIGTQGLADVFALMRLSWENPEALQLNQDIFETMYFAAMKTSCELSKKFGPYDSFKDSMTSKGIFQFDTWNHKPSDRHDWDGLKEDVKKHGLRNSLVIAQMPTASTSQILGNTESTEMITSNLYKRSTLSGEFIQENKYLVEDLLQLGLWNDTMRQKIMAADGSIQNIKEIPDDIKALYKTVWETSQKVIIDMAAARGPFICQSQSMNLSFKDANAAKISSALMYGWKKGLKTLVYYTRNTGAVEAIKFTVDKNIENEIKENEQTALEEGIACSIDNPESCVMCSS